MTSTLPAFKPGPVQWVGQVVLYSLFAAFIGYFAAQPSIALLPPAHGLLRLSFSHPGQFSTACRQRSAEELAKLPPQLRQPQDCARARSPVQVRIEMDGKLLIDQSFRPAGLSKDGASSGYWRTPLEVGTHQLRVQFRDDQRPGAPVYERAARVDVREGQIVLIDFKPKQDGVTIQ